LLKPSLNKPREPGLRYRRCHGLKPGQKCAPGRQAPGLLHNPQVQGQKGVANAPALFKEKGLSFEKLGIGGLDSQFEQIFRRAFSSRAVSAATIERMGIR
jgi:hypothetical protein